MIQQMLHCEDSFTDADGVATIATLTAPIRPQMAAVDAFLAQELGEFEPELREMIADVFAHSGKRLRPILVFFSGWANGSFTPELVRSAAIVEMVHLATLVHDDILDGAVLRHGAATTVARSGAHAAVLAGDALFAEALRLAALFPTTEVCREVSLATRRVCAGEVGQTFGRGDCEISMEAYRRAIELKTAELFRAACTLGASVSGRGEAFSLAAGQYGIHLGTAYQIYDDIADLLGDEKAIGKTLGTDLASGKYTMPVLMLFEGLDDAARRTLASELSAMGPEKLGQRLAKAGAAERTIAAFDAELDAALAAIAPFGDLPPCKPMKALAAFVRGLVARYR